VAVAELYALRIGIELRPQPECVVFDEVLAEHTEFVCTAALDESALHEY
jgi:hypothetical protein